MNTFTNGFRCAQKNDGDEVIIQFLQNFPVFDEKGTLSGSASETVSSLVMSKKTARELITILGKILPFDGLSE